MASDNQVELMSETFFSFSSGKTGLLNNIKKNTILSVTPSPKKFPQEDNIPEIELLMSYASTTLTGNTFLNTVTESNSQNSNKTLNTFDIKTIQISHKRNSVIETSKNYFINDSNNIKKSNTQPFRINEIKLENINEDPFSLEKSESLNFKLNDNNKINKNEDSKKIALSKRSSVELNSLIYSQIRKNFREDAEENEKIENSPKNYDNFSIINENLNQNKISKENELKYLTNTQDIRDFHEYTEECLNLIEKIEINIEDDLKSKKVTINKEYLEMIKKGEKKLAVFDLDETLVHREFEEYSDCDEMITVILPDNNLAEIGMYIRPHLLESLKKIAEKYILILFTASQKIYADKVMELIDPKEELFIMKLYRDSCRVAKLDEEIIYIKDLIIFENVPLDKIVIIDNSVLSFCNQLQNGIPILPFYNNKEDVELKDLVDYLDHLYYCDDLREENKIIIGLNEYNSKLKSYFSSSDNSSESESEEEKIKSNPIIHFNILESNFLDKTLNYNTNDSIPLSLSNVNSNNYKHFTSNHFTNSEISQSEISDCNTKDFYTSNKSSYDTAGRHGELYKCLEVFQKKYQNICKTKTK